MSGILPANRSFPYAAPVPQVKSRKYPAVVIALSIVIFVPYLHIGVFYLKLWVPNKQPVNKNACTCSCFDTIFKGSYESPGKTRYKHVYFNATQNTFKIWTVTVVFMMMFYESLKYLIGLYQTSRMNFSWMFLYLINIYPNYYSWWMLFGYYNDEFYPYLSHQIYFCITELILTSLVLSLCNKVSELHLWKLLIILAVSLVHILVSSLDQFITNVILGQGKGFQSSRDFGLMIPDLFHLLVSSYWYVKLIYFRDKKDSVIDFTGSRKRDLVFCIGIVLILIGLSRWI